MSGTSTSQVKAPDAEQVTDGRADQINNARRRLSYCDNLFALARGSLKQAVERFQPLAFEWPGGPSADTLRARMSPHGLDLRRGTRIEDAVCLLQAFPDMFKEMAQPPSRRLGGGGDTHPA